MEGAVIFPRPSGSWTTNRGRPRKVPPNRTGPWQTSISSGTGANRGPTWNPWGESEGRRVCLRHQRKPTRGLFVGQPSRPNPSANSVGGRGRGDLPTVAIAFARRVRPLIALVSLGVAAVVAPNLALATPHHGPQTVTSVQKRLGHLALKNTHLVEKYDRAQVDVQ